MRKNLSPEITNSETQNDSVPSGKLSCNLQTKLIIPLLLLFFSILPISSEAEYKVYLKNGNIISGVDTVKKEDSIKIYKSGVMLELPKADVIKIEEYETETLEVETLGEETAVEEKPPEYLIPEETPVDTKTEESEKRKLLRLKKQYQLVLNKLKRMETLEKRSQELKRQAHRKSYSPRKERMARKEKALIDKELERLLKEKDSLITQKEELEYQIDILERK